jgi:type I restriction enzyme M protein
MTNPPFGGSERKEVQQNFPIRTGATAYLFLQHFIKMLRADGAAWSSGILSCRKPTMHQ